MTAPRIEYGAQIVSVSSPVYMKSFDKPTVDAWLLVYGVVTPVVLVVRVWNGETCTGWELAA